MMLPHRYYTFIISITATADVDYFSIPGRVTSGRLTFNSFSTRQCTTISTRFDSRVESTEDFVVQLQMIGSLPSTVKLARTNATVFILDNDGMYIIMNTVNSEF